LSAATGTYALLLRCGRRRRVRVGSLGTIELPPGGLLYIGSAFGPGGLAARLGRHARLDHVRHWHLDYVRPFTALAGAWVCSSSQRLEHRWARAIAGLPGVSVPAARFGASDCRCPSHLFAMRIDRSLETVEHALGRCSEDAVVEISAAALRALARGRSPGVLSRG
jgi:Uri superfamily endonuclease